VDPQNGRHRQAEPHLAEGASYADIGIRCTLIRGTFHLASKRDWDALRRDVKPVYTAVNAEAARAAFDELTGFKWNLRGTGTGHVAAALQFSATGVISAQSASFTCK
jgi:hypothetical protein